MGGFFYKTNVVEGKRNSLILDNVMLQKFCGLCFTCESWDTKLVERVEALLCEANLGVIVCRFHVCCPFVAGRQVGR
jgi:hypothetical protein